MGFWFFAIVLTIAATLVVLLPLIRRRQAFLPAEKNDLEVYRDQLREVEADAARGMIDAQSAEQARIEISHRILNAEKASKLAETEEKAGYSGRLWAFLGVIMVPVIAWGVYPLYGEPDMPSMPLAERLSANPEGGTVNELIARAEVHLAENPNDVRGWDVLAPIYLRIGRPTDAVNAYRAAIRLEGENLPRLVGLGEALISVSGGPVTAEAEEVFTKAALLQPDDIRVHFYLAQRDMQDGKPEKAAQRLQALLDKAPSDAPWRAQIEQAIARISGDTPNSGPSAADVEAMSSLSPQDRQAVIEGMVQTLDAKLRENGDDLEGWQRLVRSYMVLGQQDAAQDAFKRGLIALKGSKQAELINFASGFGLQAGEMQK